MWQCLVVSTNRGVMGGGRTSDRSCRETCRALPTAPFQEEIYLTEIEENLGCLLDDDVEVAAEHVRHEFAVLLTSWGEAFIYSTLFIITFIISCSFSCMTRANCMRKPLSGIITFYSACSDLSLRMHDNHCLFLNLNGFS